MENSSNMAHKMRKTFKIVEEAAKRKLREFHITSCVGTNQLNLLTLMLLIYGADAEDHLGLPGIDKQVLEDIMYDLMFQNPIDVQNYLMLYEDDNTD